MLILTYLCTMWILSVDDTEGTEFCVKNVQVRGGYILHIGSVEGTLKVGDKVKCQVDQVCVFLLDYWFNTCLWLDES